MDFEPPRRGGWEELGAALGSVLLSVVRYGQMTAGSYCYIGPQGIVHGTVVRDGATGVGRGPGGRVGVGSRCPATSPRSSPC